MESAFLLESSKHTQNENFILHDFAICDYLDRLLVQYGNWQAPFIVAAGLLVIGAAVWAFWLDPDASVVEMQQARPAVAAPAV